MPQLRHIDLSVHGVMNRQLFSAKASITVKPAQGIKFGRVNFRSTRGRPGVRAMSALIMTNRCHIGALPMAVAPFIGPEQLLGREFVSYRLSVIGGYGSLGVSEKAKLVGDTLRCELLTVGELKAPPERATGPLVEMIRVVGPDTLLSEGQYSLEHGGGRRTRVRYTHLYRALHPNPRLFRRFQGAVFRLEVTFTNRFQGQTLQYRSTSKIRQVK